MIGTESGLWFSIKTLIDGTVDYEFYREDVQLDRGIAPNEVEMFGRFDALCEAAARPLS